MKAIYRNVLYSVLSDADDGLYLAEGLHVPFSEPRLTPNPTDGEIAALPDSYPVWLEDDPARPGLYLGLFHGSYGLDRNKARELFGDWGFNGPIIGPLKYVHTTYANHLKIEFLDAPAIELYKPFIDADSFTDELSVQFFTEDDCVVFNGDMFGDWSAFIHTQSQ